MPRAAAEAACSDVVGGSFADVAGSVICGNGHIALIKKCPPWAYLVSRCYAAAWCKVYST
jgi:hypothetical protein